MAKYAALKRIISNIISLAQIILHVWCKLFCIQICLSYNPKNAAISTLLNFIAGVMDL
jgi:hypothetical protein